MTATTATNALETLDKHLLEEEIISSLLEDKHYFNSTIHHLDQKHFTEPGNRLIFMHIKSHYLDYGGTPSLKEIILSFKDHDDKYKLLVKDSIVKVNSIKKSGINKDMLLTLTEKFIKHARFKDAIIMGADAIGEHSSDKMTESFAIAEEAVAISLESDLGTFIEDVDKRFEDYLPKAGLKLNIPSFDNMIGDGYLPKTLHLILSPSGVGKSAFLCSFGVQFLLQGRDVVIISMEMAESQFMKRMDANLFDVPIENIGEIDKQVLKNKYSKIKDTLGELVVKEFPAGGITPLGIDSYLSKLDNERGIKNPIVMVDYLSLVKSDRMKMTDNSYGYQKSVSEELRAIAQKRSLIMFTPMQTNRSSVGNLEAGQETISDSLGVYMTADSAFILLQTKDMKEKSEIKVSFVKNRMSGKTWDFNVGYDYHKFRIDDRFNIGGNNITNYENKNVTTGSNSALDLSGLMEM